MAEGSVLCGAGAVLSEDGEEFSDDHLAERETDGLAVLPAQTSTRIRRPAWTSTPV